MIGVGFQRDLLERLVLKRPRLQDGPSQKPALITPSTFADHMPGE